MAFRILCVSGLCLVAFASVAVADLKVDEGFTQQPTPSRAAISRMKVAQGGFRRVQSVPLTTGTNLVVNNPSLSTFDIVINPGPGLAANPQAIAAFERAAATWEQHISDPITVFIDADLAPLPPGVLGSTSNTTWAAPYALITAPMKTDAAGETDDGIVASLPAAGISAIVPSGFSLDGNMTLTQANLKALGIAAPGSDGRIEFASAGFAFDYDKTNGISPGAFDFEGIAAHEIGHTLGFVSEVDIVEYLDNGGPIFDFRDPGDVWPTPLDLFRFAGGPTDPTNAAQFATAPRSLLPGSVDVWDQVNVGFGGSAEVFMSTGVIDGDGNQASHWRDGLGLGLFDPTLAPGELATFPTQNDLRALDLIGYEITAVPEPSSLIFLGVVGSLSSLAEAIRRRRSRR